jgi:hypothetical protein
MKQYYKIPDEFNFISHINEITKGSIYHANKITDNYYEVTFEKSKWKYNTAELQKKIYNNRFEIV